MRQRMRMVREDALAVSAVVEQAFRGGDEVDDENLNKDLRQLFYDLQDEKILDVRREERVVEGQARRHYLWHVREDEAPAFGEGLKPDPASRLYHRLGDAAWERRRPEI